ncbi:hypothetical protein [Corynebacterium neomassiliense]|uniref:hypothetical protein n=1 Tax=Corynebacterium neomassiliense TaxID=2079482 RepID=UPI001031C77F|nr:hypothetical protein [Corynebacterium neomassiliense]
MSTAAAIAALATAIVGVIGGIWRIRKEQRELVAARIAAEADQRSVAVQATEAAVGVVKSSMDTQGETVTSLQRRVDGQGVRLNESERQITRQAERITDLDQRHGVAIGHIAEREDDAADNLGPDRPV